MDDVIGLQEYLEFVMALALVLGLIALLAFGAKRFGFGAIVSQRGKSKRLALTEVIPIDGKRRLILVRRDNAEHLILLGPTSDTLIEKNILHDGDTNFAQALDMATSSKEPTDVVQ
ncbi:MAG: flagellar biosynthetic protein FliO [Alphaproteobacteria bacterium]|nr:flagellar biosynthetic protein FliO [Rhodospirillales bacterium]MCW9046106.1 flagellar biosynthetic protein FliO [Alphaproteobacteria bacterium]